jgi:hypothetical protein
MHLRRAGVTSAGALVPSWLRLVHWSRHRVLATGARRGIVCEPTCINPPHSEPAGVVIQADLKQGGEL